MMPHKSPSQPALFPLAAGAICASLGMTVLFGWYTHDLHLIHVLPSFVGMAFNTALGFLLGGASLMAAALGRPRAALLACAYAFLVGVPTLAEYVTGCGFGLDDLLMPAYTRAGVTQMGRMAVATAVCFTFLGFAFLCLNLPERLPGRAPMTGLLGALIAGLGVIALFGYINDVAASYTWGELTRMAVHTACGFLLMGLGVVSLAWSTERRAGTEGTPRWLAGLVGIAAATASLCIWQALTVQERTQTALMTKLAERSGLGLGGAPRTTEMLTDGALVVGLFVSALLAMEVSLAQTARRQSVALARGRDELEIRVQERTAELAAANRAISDVLLAVTDGKLHLCDTSRQLPPALGPKGAPIPLGRQDIRTFRHHVRCIAQDAGLPPERSSDLETAVGEASMNAAVHGKEGLGETCSSAHGTVQVWVTDTGQGIAMEHLPRATLERGYTTSGTLGHGFWLMLNTVDRVWLLTGPSGTTIVLEQDRISPAPAWLRTVVESHSL